MDHAVIPAPARLEAGAGRGFAFRPGMAVAYADTGITPIAERFCAQVARRTGLRLVPRRGGPVPGEPSVTIELAAPGELGGLPAPAGLSPAGGDPAGESYVPHLHLTDDQAWRLPTGRPAGKPEPGEAWYRDEDLTELVGYAADRFVTIVPEVDTPGHASALLRLRPELRTGRNEVEYELRPGRQRRAVWLDPELPATFGLMEQVLAGVAAIFPGPFLHIGADEPRGMPDEEYASYVRRLRRLVRTLGRRPLGWQESARAGLAPDDVIQYWLTGIDLAASVPPQVRAQLDADLALARRDVEAAVAASVPVIVSPLPYCYLDVPYSEPSADATQKDRQGRAGLRLYAPRTVATSFGWEPAEVLGPGRSAQVAGVEAAIWAETITGFGDLSFLLLPRLAGAAHKAWSPAELAGWPGHRDRLARHGRLWAQDGLTYFRASTVDWA